MAKEVFPQKDINADYQKSQEQPTNFHHTQGPVPVAAPHFSLLSFLRLPSNPTHTLWKLYPPPLPPGPQLSLIHSANFQNLSINYSSFSGFFKIFYREDNVICE